MSSNERVNENQCSSENNEAAFDAWLAGRTSDDDGDFLLSADNVIYQVSGQTQMRTKDRDRAKLKSVVDSFKLR